MAKEPIIWLQLVRSTKEIGSATNSKGSGMKYGQIRLNIEVTFTKARKTVKVLYRMQAEVYMKEISSITCFMG